MKNTAELIHSEFKKSLELSVIKDTKEFISNKQDSLMYLMENVGLTNTSTYNKLNTIKKDVNKIKLENLLITSIKKYETIYPTYRLIGLKKVLELCEKYNLYLSNIETYIGVIPESNLNDIKEHRKIVKSADVINSNNIFDMIENTRYFYEGMKYFIVAPRHDFKKKLDQIDRVLINHNKPKFVNSLSNIFKPITLDPIILCPMKVDNAVIFQIVTAWGPEANDESITKKLNIESSKN